MLPTTIYEGEKIAQKILVLKRIHYYIFLQWDPLHVYLNQDKECRTKSDKSERESKLEKLKNKNMKKEREREQVIGWKKVRKRERKKEKKRERERERKREKEREGQT